jgi:hypothetical protein
MSGRHEITNGLSPTQNDTLETVHGSQSSHASSSTQTKGGSHHLSTSTTTPGALQDPLSHDDDDENCEDNEDYSTDEDYSKVNSEEAKLKRKLVKEIKAAANKIIDLLEEFVQNLRMLIGVKTLSFSESHLDPEDF